MKKAWTLIEVLISVTILSILFLAMSNVIGNLKISKNVIANRFEKNKKQEIFIKVLYSDILNAQSLQILNTQNKDYIRLLLRTKNSLYNLIEPYVLWYVSKNENSLIRAESWMQIKDGSIYYADKFMQNVKKFKIFQKNDKYFIYIDTSKPIYFEIYK